ncbi:MAG TPA: hypothetical protein VFN11_16870, partial [Ktedonobacterales bacterium]|nr:hypothetical protein [Ktedonobacterales bacterium]
MMIVKTAVYRLRRSGRSLRALLGSIALVLVLVGCDLGQIAPGGQTSAPTPTATSSNMDQRIDAYIASLTPAQQIGQTLMLAVYANA